MANRITIVTAILGSGILSTVISHLLYNQKLRKEQLMKSESGVGAKMRIALEEALEIVSVLHYIELFDAECALEAPNFRSMGNDNIIYPMIFNDSQTLYSFHEMINSFRAQYERYVDCKTALGILLIDRYVTQLILFLKGYDEKYWSHWGVIFNADIKMMSQRCEKRIIKRINKQKYEMEYHGGSKWEILRKYVFIHRWKKTLLRRIIDAKQLKPLEAEAIKELHDEMNSCGAK